MGYSVEPVFDVNGGDIAVKEYNRIKLSVPKLNNINGKTEFRATDTFNQDFEMNIDEQVVFEDKPFEINDSVIEENDNINAVTDVEYSYEPEIVEPVTNEIALDESPTTVYPELPVGNVITENAGELKHTSSPIVSQMPTSIEMWVAKLEEIVKNDELKGTYVLKIAKDNLKYLNKLLDDIEENEQKLKKQQEDEVRIIKSLDTLDRLSTFIENRKAIFSNNELENIEVGG